MSALTTQVFIKFMNNKSQKRHPQGLKEMLAKASEAELLLLFKDITERPFQKIIQPDTWRTNIQAEEFLSIVELIPAPINNERIVKFIAEALCKNACLSNVYYFYEILPLHHTVADYIRDHGLISVNVSIDCNNIQELATKLALTNNLKGLKQIYSSVLPADDQFSETKPWELIDNNDFYDDSIIMLTLEAFKWLYAEAGMRSQEIYVSLADMRRYDLIEYLMQNHPEERKNFKTIFEYAVHRSESDQQTELLKKLTLLAIELEQPSESPMQLFDSNKNIAYLLSYYSQAQQMLELIPEAQRNELLSKPDAKGWLPIHIAGQRGHITLIKWLCDLNIPGVHYLTETQDKHKKTSLDLMKEHRPETFFEISKTLNIPLQKLYSASKNPKVLEIFIHRRYSYIPEHTAHEITTWLISDITNEMRNEFLAIFYKKYRDSSLNNSDFYKSVMKNIRIAFDVFMQYEGTDRNLLPRELLDKYPLPHERAFLNFPNTTTDHDVLTELAAGIIAPKMQICVTSGNQTLQLNARKFFYAKLQAIESLRGTEHLIPSCDSHVTDLMQAITKVLATDDFIQNPHKIEPSAETEQRITRLAYSLQKISHYFEQQCMSDLSSDDGFDPNDFQVTLEKESPAAQFADKGQEPCQATIFSGRRNSM